MIEFEPPNEAHVLATLQAHLPNQDARLLADWAQREYQEAQDYNVPTIELIRWLNEERLYHPDAWHEHCVWYVRFQRDFGAAS
jgi:hypothetical protein